MEATTERERAAQVAAPNLTRAQEDLLRRIWARETLSLSDVGDSIEDALGLVDGGYARLAAVVYPWGLDFQLEATGAAWAPRGCGPRA